MSMTNQQIVKETISTATVTSGLLNPEQSKKFLKQIFESTTLGSLIRHEIRKSKTGEIDKIGIASRIVRKKTENVDDGHRASVNFSAVEYATTAVRLPWEITEETLRENIEGEDLEATITDLMTTQLGLDMEDLQLNGDTDTPDTDSDYDFLKINDGWVKQIKNGGHVFNAAEIGGDLTLDCFYGALAALPNKYNNGKLRWIMSPRRAQQWEQYLLNKIIDAGGAVPESVYSAPAKIPTVSCPSLDDDIILLTDPKNLISVKTYEVKIRKDAASKDAIMLDKRFYVTHLDFDPIIEELDATAIITGLH